jgi:hypothetical protein
MRREQTWSLALSVFSCNHLDLAWFPLFNFGDCGLNSELYTCKTGAQPLEPHLQSIFLW